MRAFIGIDFCKALKDEIGLLQNTLRKYTVSGRWKYIGNFHLTLKFLDEIDNKQIAAVNGILKDIASQTPFFNLEISDMGCFKGRDCLRVVYLALDGEVGKLLSLQKNIDTELSKIGFKPEERQFRPHITLGQDIVFDRSFEEISKIVSDKNYTRIDANKINLYKSEQISGKRVYTVIGEHKFPHQPFIDCVSV